MAKHECVAKFVFDHRGAAEYDWDTLCDEFAGYAKLYGCTGPALVLMHPAVMIVLRRKDPERFPVEVPSHLLGARLEIIEVCPCVVLAGRQ